MRSRLDELLPLAKQNDGLVTARQAGTLGIAASVLARVTQRGRLERVARGVDRIPYFFSHRLSPYREAVLWARASRGPEHVALSHETALAVYGISDVNPSRVHLAVPRGARLRQRQPTWIVIHPCDLPPANMTTREGLPVTTVAKSVMDVMEATGTLGVARQAIRNARKEGYMSAAEMNRLTRQLNQHPRGDSRMLTAREHATK
jgi:predicted transcriptional regulator of viral defense system